MRRARPEDFDNCIEILICIMCRKYIGQGAGYYTINFDDDPDAWAVAHSSCAESDYIDDGSDDEYEGEIFA